MTSKRAQVADTSTHAHLATANGHHNTVADKVGTMTFSSGNLKTSPQTDRTQDVHFGSNSQAITHGTAITIDCVEYRAIRIWGDTTGQLDVTATNATNTGNAGFWDSFDTLPTGIFSKYYVDPPRNIKITNNTGSTIGVVNLQYGRFK